MKRPVTQASEEYHKKLGRLVHVGEVVAFLSVGDDKDKGVGAGEIESWCFLEGVGAS